MSLGLSEFTYVGHLVLHLVKRKHSINTCYDYYYYYYHFLSLCHTNDKHSQQNEEEQEYFPALRTWASYADSGPQVPSLLKRYQHLPHWIVARV